MTFRQRGGEAIVSRRRRAASVPATEIQMKNQEQFREATKYAKTVIKDPVIKALYATVATSGETAYNVAFSDAFKGPEIKSVSICEYYGQPGDLILIKADKFLVLKMNVMIVNADGVVEEGQATVAGKAWKYTVSMLNEAVHGSRVIVTTDCKEGSDFVIPYSGWKAYYSSR